MNKRANIGLISSVAFHGLLILVLAFSGIFSTLHKQSKMLEITFVDIAGGGGGGGSSPVYNPSPAKPLTSESRQAISERTVVADYSKDSISATEVAPTTEVVDNGFENIEATEAAGSGSGSGSGAGSGSGSGSGSGTGSGSGSGSGSGTGPGSGSGSGSGNQVSIPPRLLRSSNPAYPSQARQAGITGQVGLRIRVDADGEVSDVQVIASSGSEVLDNAALKEVWKWQFSAAKNAFGKKVACYVTRTINFSLNNR